METSAAIPRRTIVIVISLSAILLFLWTIFTSSYIPPSDRRISGIALSTSGKWLAAGTAAGVITLWDQKSGGNPQRISFSHGVLNDLQFSPDGGVLAIASKDLAIYDVAQSSAPRLLRSDQGNYGSVRFSPDGQTIVVVTGAGVIETLDAQSGARKLEICCSSIYGEAVFTPDGKGIVNAGHWPGIWDAHSGQLVGRLTRSREFYTFRPIAFDGRGAILMGSQDGRVYAWNLQARRLLAASPPQPAYVDTLIVSSNGWAVYAGFGKSIELWNPDSGQRRSLPDAKPTSNIILNPDGTSIIFGTADGSVEFWGLREERQIRKIHL